MTSIRDALVRAGITPASAAIVGALAPLIPAPRRDPQLDIAYWHHPCSPSCRTWVPNHLSRCARHRETT